MAPSEWAITAWAGPWAATAAARASANSRTELRPGPRGRGQVAVAGGVEGDHAEAGRDQRGDEGVQLPAPPAPAVDQVDGRRVGPVGRAAGGSFAPDLAGDLPAAARPGTGGPGAPAGRAAVPVGTVNQSDSAQRAPAAGATRSSRANDRTIVLFLIAARRLEGISRSPQSAGQDEAGRAAAPAPRRRGWRGRRRRGRRAAGWRGGRPASSRAGRRRTGRGRRRGGSGPRRRRSGTPGRSCPASRAGPGPAGRARGLAGRRTRRWRRRTGSRRAGPRCPGEPAPEQLAHPGLAAGGGQGGADHQVDEAGRVCRAAGAGATPWTGSGRTGRSWRAGSRRPATRWSARSARPGWPPGPPRRAGLPGRRPLAHGSDKSTNVRLNQVGESASAEGSEGPEAPRRRGRGGNGRPRWWGRP